MINRAAELGPARFSWWQDWRGECVAIVASGPSTSKAAVEALRDRIHVIAIKQNVELAPWAEVVYGCDAPWWIWRKGLPEYRGIKITQARLAKSRYSDLVCVEVKHVDKLLVDEPGIIGSGGNSGFQALNLAVQFGATGIMLIGFDYHDKGGVHWYGRNQAQGMNNPGEVNFSRWRRALAAIVSELEARGIDVVNASNGSSITCLRKRGIDETFRQWGL
jgi:hypothetical protein